MDTVITQVYTQLVREHRVSADDIAFIPRVREEFVSQSQRLLGMEVEEETLLRRLHGLRKQSKLPRLSDILAV